MALTTTNMQYGRDDAGKQKLLSELKADATKLKNAARGGEYNSLISCIKANWAGEDANQVLKTLDSISSQLQSSADKTYAKMENIIEADSQQFKSFQSTNMKIN